MLFQELEMDFMLRVEELAESNGGSYIDAVVDACEHFNIEPKVGARLLSRPIIEKIESEGHECNLLPSRSKLPI
jgi:hypothetical protein